MFLIFKLRDLYAAVVALEAKFPSSQLDAQALFADVQTAVLTKAWTLGAFQQVVADGTKLVSDFAAEWTGSADQLAAFVAAFKALFA